MLGRLRTRCLVILASSAAGGWLSCTWNCRVPCEPTLLHWRYPCVPVLVVSGWFGSTRLGLRSRWIGSGSPQRTRDERRIIFRLRGRCQIICRSTQARFYLTGLGSWALGGVSDSSLWEFICNNVNKKPPPTILLHFLILSYHFSLFYQRSNITGLLYGFFKSLIKMMI